MAIIPKRWIQANQEQRFKRTAMFRWLKTDLRQQLRVTRFKIRRAWEGGADSRSKVKSQTPPERNNGLRSMRNSDTIVIHSGQCMPQGIPLLVVVIPRTR